jgi:hypothetical protein
MSETIETTNKDGIVYVSFDKSGKRGTYRILPPKPGKRQGQFEYCEEIQFEGFTKLPFGFYTQDGLGLTGGGFYLLKAIYEKYGKKIDVVIIVKGNSEISARGARVKFILPYSDLKTLNAKVREIKQERNEDIRSTINFYLRDCFPRRFIQEMGTKNKYIPGSLATALERDDVISHINARDRYALEQLIPNYLSSIQATLAAPDKLKVVYDSLDAGKVLYFRKIVQEFHRKLKKATQEEAEWQDFLSEHILILRSGYGHKLEKNSVTLQGKFPDFMLIDPYGYLDIYEIKKPSTRVLRHDSSRNNYYWDTEIAKAISQVENYLHQVQRNSDGLINDIRRNKRIDINIVRPRGYIIAGLRSDLTDQKMVDDFRILNESLKNIDILFYDDLVENLETFVKRLGVKKGKSTSTRRTNSPEE